MTRKAETAARPSGQIRILHVVLSLEPGGMENGLVNVAQSLDPAEFEVHVACLERGGDFVERLPEPSLARVLDKPPPFSARTVYRLAQQLRSVRPQVVHSHNLGPLIYACLATCLGLRYPLLHGEHGQLPLDQRTPGLLRLRRLLYARCRAIHTVSRGLRDHLVEFGMPGEKILPLVNGVDTTRFQPADKAVARRQIGLPPDGFLIGAVGRLCHNKRFGLLIDAFTNMAGDFPGAQLVLVGGSGPDAEAIRQHARQSPVASRIHLVGSQRRPEPYYQAMDLLVAPSVIEGLSNVVLEAMACGVPVLAHQACGNAEVIRGGVDGFVADLSTAESLCGQMRMILATPLALVEMGCKARQSMVNGFSLAGMANAYADLYRKMAAKKGSSNNKTRRAGQMLNE
jgi:glycosyltransferase involved in cell wall biosynthesis